MSAIVCISILLLLIAGSLAQAQGPRVGEPPIEGTPTPPEEKPARERPRRQERAPLPGPREIGVAGAPAHDFDVLLWGDDFESGTYDDWSWDGLWHTITHTHPSGCGNSYSPVTSFWYGQNATCDYDTGAANTGFLTLTTPISLPSSLSNAGLSFWSWEETESEGGYFDYDIRTVEVATDTVSPYWTPIWSTLTSNTTEGVWHPVKPDLTPYIGNDIILRFQFDTVDELDNGYKGWYVDDVAVGYDLAFEPSVGVEKTGDALSKIGDEVDYTITITNTSSPGSPNLIKDSISDTLLTLSPPAACDSLVPGASCTITASYVVQPGDPDPLVNTVEVHYHPDGFPIDVWASDFHSVNLFEPSIVVIKTGDALSKIGDEVTYIYTITNTSSTDTPNLSLVSVIDDKVGNITAPAAAATPSCSNLGPGESCNFDVNFTIPQTEDDPYVNRVDVIYTVNGLGNEVSAWDTHSVSLFQEYYIYLPLILKNY